MPLARLLLDAPSVRPVAAGLRITPRFATICIAEVRNMRDFRTAQGTTSTDHQRGEVSAVRVFAQRLDSGGARVAAGGARQDGPQSGERPRDEVPVQVHRDPDRRMAELL
jgi:hypothetical protein